LTITATPDITTTPPSVEIDMSLPVGAVMQSVTLSRIDSVNPGPTRVQPSAGFDSRVITDVECPYDVPATYQWTTTYIDPSAITAIWTEAWANLSAWTAVGSSWSVSGGNLVWTGSDNLTASVTRALTPGLYQVIFASPPVGIQTINFGGFYIDVARSRLVAGTQSQQFVAGAGAWTVSMSATAVTITTDSGTYSVQLATQATQIAFIGPVQQFGAAPTDIALPVGTGAGQFQGGGDIAVDPVSGNILIVDPQNARIQVWTPAGAPLTSFGTAGTGNGQFTSGDSMHLAIDASRNVYVAASSRIQKFAWNAGTSNYVYSAKVGSVGTGNGQFNGIGGLALDSTPNLYATDYNNNRVQKFTSALVYTSQFGSVGGTNGLFRNPQGIAIDSAGNIAVADSTRVQVFTSAGVFARLLAPQGTADGSIYYPEYGMAALGTDFYVVSIGAATVATPYLGDTAIRSVARVQKFDALGNFYGVLDYIGISGDFGINDLALAFLVDGTLLIRDSVATSPYTGVHNPDGLLHKWSQSKAVITGVTLNEFGAPTTLTESAPPVTLSPADGWIIHPARPGLSIPLTFDENSDEASIVSIDPIVNAGNVNLHYILGSATPISTITGPRYSDTSAMTIGIVKQETEKAITALLLDQLPLLINLPAAPNVGFDYGYYQVGDVTRARVAQVPDFEYRDFVLPLTAVQSPTVTQENTGWSYAELLLDFASYADADAAYATYADMTTDTRVSS
jgi:hypothetical protein